MRTILRFLVWTLLIIAVVAGGTAWWFIYRPLPQLDGSISLPGLQKEVTVERDNWGVPHIRAVFLVDAVEAQGYVMAQDRLWQLDLMRRASRGQLSEIVGPLALKSDKQFRTFRLLPRRRTRFRCNGQRLPRADGSLRSRRERFSSSSIRTICLWNLLFLNTNPSPGSPPIPWSSPATCTKR